MRITENFTLPLSNGERQTITVELVQQRVRLNTIEISTPLQETPNFFAIEERELWKFIGMLQALQRRAEGK